MALLLRRFQSTWSATHRIPNLKTTLSSDAASHTVHNHNEAADIVTHLLRTHSHKVLVLTGAGVSTDSGIPDYRGEQGTYVRNPKHRPILYHEFISATDDFRKRYWARGYLGWPRISQARPNPTHHALAHLLEHEHISHIVTQNVDHLHHLATDVSFRHAITELHGTLYEVICLQCRHSVPRHHYQHRLTARNPDWSSFNRSLIENKINPDGDVELPSNISYANFDIAPCTACHSRLVKPRVVFFGEMVEPAHKRVAEDAVTAADALLVIGSSLATYSSYRLVRAAYDRQIPIIILNKGQTRADAFATSKLDVPCSPVMEQVALSLK